MSASFGGAGARDPRHPETSRLASTSNCSWWPCWCNATPLQSPLVPAFIPRAVQAAGPYPDQAPTSAGTAAPRAMPACMED